MTRLHILLPTAVFILFVLVETPAAEVAALRLGVIGDSLSSGYRGGPGAPRDWIDLLAAARGIDFGPATDRAGRRSPHGHVWAAVGSTSGDAVAADWPDRAAAAMTEGALDAVCVCIGHDDFRPLLETWLRDGVVTRAAADAVVVGFDRNLATILDRLQGAGRGRIAVCTLAEWDRTVFVRRLGLTADEYRLLAATTDRVNRLIRDAVRRRRLVLVDLAEGLRRLLARPLRIGGVRIETAMAADEPRFFFRADGMHPGTVGSACIANVVVSALAPGGAQAMPPLTADEILGLAGLGAPAMTDPANGGIHRAQPAAVAIPTRGRHPGDDP